MGVEVGAEWVEDERGWGGRESGSHRCVAWIRQGVREGRGQRKVLEGWEGVEWGGGWDGEGGACLIDRYEIVEKGRGYLLLCVVYYSTYAVRQRQTNHNNQK